MFFLIHWIQATEKKENDKELINKITEKEEKKLINLNHGWTELSNVDWQMLVFDREHVKEMDAKHHPEELFTFDKTNQNIY